MRRGRNPFVSAAKDTSLSKDMVDVLFLEMLLVTARSGSPELEIQVLTASGAGANFFALVSARPDRGNYRSNCETTCKSTWADESAAVLATVGGQLMTVDTTWGR